MLVALWATTHLANRTSGTVDPNTTVLSEWIERANGSLNSLPAQDPITQSETLRDATSAIVSVWPVVAESGKDFTEQDKALIGPAVQGMDAAMKAGDRVKYAAYLAALTRSARMNGGPVSSG